MLAYVQSVTLADNLGLFLNVRLKLQAQLHTMAQLLQSHVNFTCPRTNDSGHAATKATKGIKHYLSAHMVHQAMALEYRG